MSDGVAAVLATCLPLLLAVPLLAAGLAAVVSSDALRRAVGLLTAAFALCYSGLLLWATADGSVLVEQVSGWPGGVAIAWAADTLSALMVAVASLLVLVCSAYAARAGDDRDLHWVPLVLVMSGGVYGAFVTADLFNLFVMIEVALVPSYVLLTRSGVPAAVAAGRVYLTVNLLVSTVLLTGVALVYGVTGTVNLGELAGAATDSIAAALAAGLVLVALAGKAALVPVHGWLPRTYPYASTAVNAMISGLLTKIGVYGLFRVWAVVFDGGDARLAVLAQVVLGATMVVGVFGALGETTTRSVLAFHMVSQVGYILLGLGFFGVAGLAAGVFYLIHHIVVKAALFLAVGAVEETHKTARLDRLGGVARAEPLLAFVFLGAALSLVGIPPFSGFVAKYALVRAAVEGQALVVAGVAVAVSLFTLLSMLKLWNGVFWGRSPELRSAPAPVIDESSTARVTTAENPRGGRSTSGMQVPVDGAGGGHRRVPLGLVMPAAALTLMTLLIGVGAQGLLGLATTAAEGLVDTTAYESAVSGP